MKKSIIKTALFMVLFYIINCSSAKTVKNDTMETISTIGIFEGKIITVGNFQGEHVYKINEYYISLHDITQNRYDLLKGKKVQVTGELKVVKGKLFPAKSCAGGRIYEPYKEPDKKFIYKPVFTIIND